MTQPRESADRVWIAILVLSFVFGLGASWQRWGNPLIDTGREMNQPLRLLDGETLYADVRHIYGPLSPWLHAGLFHAFGPSLAVLYAGGIMTAALVLWLVYWIGRRFMGPAAAAAATLGVMFLCVFKPAGNYILPYSYNALHGTALGLLALAALLGALAPSARRRPWRFAAAGGLAGLAVLAKTEAGLAAVAAGLAAALLAPGAGWHRRLAMAASFVLPAAVLVVGVYAAIAARVGWATLATDSWLLLYNVPPELKHYNGWISGLSDPLRSLRRVLTAVVKLGILAAIIAAVSRIIAARRRADGGEAADGGVVSRRGSLRLLTAALAIAAALSVTAGLDWDRGPYLAMPVLLAAFILLLLVHPHRAAAPAEDGLWRDTASRRAVLLTCAIFALVSLARMILHVRSGGAHASFLLPVSIVLFTYLWVGPFAAAFTDPRAGRLAGTVAVSLIVFDAAATALIQAYRYRTRQTVAIESPRGTMVVAPPLGEAWNEALAFIGRRTAPGDAVAVLPEGTSLTFLSGRRHPLREEITTPGFLDEEGERRAIRDLAGSRLILIANRPTREFGAEAFGRDYNRRLMGWIEAQYTPCGIFGPVEDPGLQVGDPPFFIRAYCPD